MSWRRSLCILQNYFDILNKSKLYFTLFLTEIFLTSLSQPFNSNSKSFWKRRLYKIAVSYIDCKVSAEQFLFTIQGFLESSNRTVSTHLASNEGSHENAKSGYHWRAIRRFLPPTPTTTHIPPLRCDPHHSATAALGFRPLLLLLIKTSERRNVQTRYQSLSPELLQEPLCFMLARFSGSRSLNNCTL